MDRRVFLGTLAGGLFAAPLAVEAQPKAPVRIGFLPLGSPSNTYDRGLVVDAFRQGLNEVGVVENRDVVAKALGLTIPPSPLARADQVIEQS